MEVGMEIVDLGFGVTFRVFPETRYVETLFPDGFRAGATREPTAENLKEAEEQGYEGPDRCWRSLIEHELMHTLVARALFDRESIVLRYEAGAELAPYGRRLLEEGVVLSLQHFLNWHEMDEMLCYRGLAQVAARARQLADEVMGLTQPGGGSTVSATTDTP
jgi:hypothetical protein